MIVYLLFTWLFTQQRQIKAIVYLFTCLWFTHLFSVNNRYQPAPLLDWIVYLAGKLGLIVYLLVNNRCIALFTSSLLVNNHRGWV